MQVVEKRILMQVIIKKILIGLLLSCFLLASAKADTGETAKEVEAKEFKAVDAIMEHISDSNEWHLWTTTDAQGHEHHVAIPLPIIVYDGEFKVFMSTLVHGGHNYKGYTLKEGKLHSLDGKKKAGFLDLFSGLENTYIDFSISKNVVALLFSVFLIFFLFRTMAISYQKNQLRPKGLTGALEPIVLFVRDEIAIPNIGKNKYDKFLPYLLTVFFFIWINNLLGLIPFFPGGANVTGNIATTATLAIITFIIVNWNGNKNYWKHIFNTPGVPAWLLPIMIPIEIIGMFTKPFALMMRLFANITAGHIMLLSLISLIFIFKTALVGVGSVPIALFVSVLELLVAVLQAYIFTVLSALFIGLAVADHH